MLGRGHPPGHTCIFLAPWGVQSASGTPACLQGSGWSVWTLLQQESLALRGAPQLCLGKLNLTELGGLDREPPGGARLHSNQKQPKRALALPSDRGAGTWAKMTHPEMAHFHLAVASHGIYQPTSKLKWQKGEGYHEFSFSVWLI